MPRLAGIVAAIATVAGPAVASAQDATAPVAAPSEVEAAPAPPAAPVAVAVAPGALDPTPAAPPPAEISAPGTVAPTTAPPTTAVAAAAAPAAAVGLAALAARDVAASRAYLSGTAITPRQGTITFETRQPLWPAGHVSLSAAIHDRVELSAGLLWAIADRESGGGYTISGRIQVLRGDRAALAVSLGHAGIVEDDDNDGVSALGLIASACVDGDRCRVLLSGAITALVTDDEDEVPVLAGGSALMGGDRDKLVLELHVTSVDYDDASASESIFGGYAGYRHGWARATLDLGVAVGSAEDDVIGWPVAALSFVM